MKNPSREAAAFDWQMTMMRRAFRDLAVSFATVDARLADQALMRIEQDAVAGMEKLIQQPPEGVTASQVKAIAVEMIIPFREMTQEARALAQQAGKPRQ